MQKSVHNIKAAIMCSEGVSAYLFLYFTLCQQSPAHIQTVAFGFLSAWGPWESEVPGPDP